MNILLTGATGFLGSYLLRKLDSLEFNIIAIKRTFSNVERISDIMDSKNITFYDIDDIKIEEIFKENEIDIIIHTATEYGKDSTPIYKILETNVVLPVRLLELGILHRSKFFINTDSYFNKENSSYSYLLNYSLSKKSLLTWLKYLSNKIKVVNIVLEHVYGPADNEHKFVEYVTQQIAINNSDTIGLTHGHQKRDFIYVTDVIDAYIKIIEFAIKNDFHYKTFEVGTGKSIEIKEFVNTIKEVSNSQTVLDFGQVPYRSDEIMDSKADISELARLDWKATVSLIEGINNIIAYNKRGK